MSYQTHAGYAGDLLATDAFALLESNASSVLIDVRTQAEWSFVGAPDLAALGKAPIYLEWQCYPSMQVDPQFAARLEALLKARGREHGDPLLFLCRSGARSRHAAVAMTSAGWGPCFNIVDGFEGPLDGLRRRGGVAGWKAGGLPWAQT
ncbi:MAG: rhodanese-like domain-containing protein [Hyphomicrobiales bacterium]|nr:rhodanese-like domain-containing protein [Hyphomicrobiales bacterium]